MTKEREMIKLQEIKSVFEQELHRLLSPIEIEIIDGWKSQGFSDATIKDALKEAIYNGADANSYKYIAKILKNWQSVEQAANVITSQGQEESNDTTESVQDDDFPWLN